MSEFGKYLADMYKARVQDKRTSDAILLGKQTLIREKAPKLWDDLRELFKDRCKDFNTELGSDLLTWDVVRNDTLSITRTDDHAHLSGAFDSSAQLLTLSGKVGTKVGVDEKFVATIWGDGVMFQRIDPSKEERQPQNLQEIVDEIIERFLTL